MIVKCRGRESMYKEAEYYVLRVRMENQPLWMFYGQRRRGTRRRCHEIAPPPRSTETSANVLSLYGRQVQYGQKTQCLIFEQRVESCCLNTKVSTTSVS
jgi:hypothetical protein